MKNLVVRWGCAQGSYVWRYYFFSFIFFRSFYTQTLIRSVSSLSSIPFNYISRFILFRSFVMMIFRGRRRPATHQVSGLQYRLPSRLQSRAASTSIVDLILLINSSMMAHMPGDRDPRRLILQITKWCSATSVYDSRISRTFGIWKLSYNSFFLLIGGIYWRLPSLWKRQIFSLEIKVMLIKFRS
jgi:hypothetical protein